MEDELPIGTIVGGRYRIERLLGRGGMGVVYSAQHTSLHRPVALKTLVGQAAKDEVAVARFLQEARAAASIGHPGIVEIFDLSHPGELPFLAMEKLEGETLRTRIARGPFTPTALLEIAIPLSEAVGAAHAHGIVHRDLKPDNVFLAEPGARVKVLDFGIAKLSGPTFELGLTQTGQVLGTPNYMAPEQMRGRADARTDVYALATILYECLVGALPFEATHLTELISKVSVDPAPLITRPDVPPHLVLLIAACLEKDPAKRPADARALAAALRDGGRSGGTTLPMAVAGQTVRMRRSPARFLLWAALAIPVLAMGGGACLVAFAPWDHGAGDRAEAPEPEPIAEAETPAPPDAGAPVTPLVMRDGQTITITLPGQEEPEVDHAAVLAGAGPIERRCIAMHAASVRRSHDEYYAWARQGPADAEQVGGLSMLEDGGEACEFTVGRIGRDPHVRALYAQAAPYARAVRTLAPLVNEASAYYANRTYEQDGMQRGRELHERLRPAFNEYFPTEQPLRAALHEALQRSREQRLKEVDLPERAVHLFQFEAANLAWIARQIDITERGLMYGPAETRDAIDAVEQAHAELVARDGPYRAAADAYLAAALALRARLRRARPLPASDPTGSPANVVAAYDALLVPYYDTTGG